MWGEKQTMVSFSSSVLLLSELTTKMKYRRCLSYNDIAREVRKNTYNYNDNDNDTDTDTTEHEDDLSSQEYDCYNEDNTLLYLLSPTVITEHIADENSWGYYDHASTIEHSILSSSSSYTSSSS